MKTIFFIFLICITSAYSQVFPVDTLLISGSLDKRINIVILSDGYQQSELDKFSTDTKQFIDNFFNVNPYSVYKNYFNVFIVKVPSQESGASHPGTAPDCPSSTIQPIINVDNYFGSTFDYNNVHRLLVATNISSITDVIANNLPQYDVVFILCNSPYYGGSGGQYATSSTQDQAKEIVLHEMGHTLANLADEYGGDGSYMYATETPNTTLVTTRDEIKWKMWINDSVPIPTPPTSEYTNVIGLFEGAQYADNGRYRPKFNCKMRALGVPFCEVCTQTIIERIHALTNPIDNYTPKDSNLTSLDSIIKFKVDLILPIPNSLKIDWLLDGKNKSHNTDTFNLERNKLNKGKHTVDLTVIDTTSQTMDVNHYTDHIFRLSWSIDNTLSVISSEEYKYKINIYPNPFSDVININLENKNENNLKIFLVDLTGKRIDLINKLLPVGENNFPINIKELNIPDGAYILNIEINGAPYLYNVVKFSK